MDAMTRRVKVLTLVVALYATPMGRPQAQPAYSFHRALVIDHSRVPNTDQSNFPVLVLGTYSFLRTQRLFGR